MGIAKSSEQAPERTTKLRFRFLKRFHVHAQASPEVCLRMKVPSTMQYFLLAILLGRRWYMGNLACNINSNKLHDFKSLPDGIVGFLFTFTSGQWHDIAIA